MFILLHALWLQGHIPLNEYLHTMNHDKMLLQHLSSIKVRDVDLNRKCERVDQDEKLLMEK